MMGPRSQLGQKSQSDHYHFISDVYSMSHSFISLIAMLVSLYFQHVWTNTTVYPVTLTIILAEETTSSFTGSIIPLVVLVRPNNHARLWTTLIGSKVGHGSIPVGIRHGNVFPWCRFPHEFCLFTWINALSSRLNYRTIFRTSFARRLDHTWSKT